MVVIGVGRVKIVAGRGVPTTSRGGVILLQMRAMLLQVFNQGESQQASMVFIVRGSEGQVHRWVGVGGFKIIMIGAKKGT